LSTEVLTERRGHLLELTLNRPERLNAVSEQLYTALLQQLREAEADESVRTVLISGAGRAFCVGADLKSHATAQRSPQQLRDYISLGQAVCEQMQKMLTPVVAKVRGYALGAGAEMAVSADFLIMAADAQMGFPEASIATFVGGAVTYRLPRLVGLRRATELLLIGERFTGGDALQWGLAYAAPKPEELDAECGQLIDRLNRNAPLSMARMKRALRQNTELDAALQGEAQDLLEIMQTRDWAEGVAAFAERRQPTFTGN
jgi:enoyl-CoA hydratase